MAQTKLTRGHIFDIQGFSVHDGPGCRTLIFFKGCSLDCPWCSNPEGKSFFPEPLYRESQCTFDGLCADACPFSAISIVKTGGGSQLVFNRALCAKCLIHDCAKACSSGAVNIGGYEIFVEDLYAKINRDRQFWGERGGITLTGGEPLAQPEFAHDLLKRCYEAYIHTAIETCGNVPWGNYEISLPYIDWIFFDLKTMDESPPPDLQPTLPPLRLSAISNVSRILDNAACLAREFHGRLIFRLPVIPGFNDDAENIRKTAHFLQTIKRNEINILPLHHLGREKYILLGKAYQMAGFKTPDKDDLARIASQFKSYGIRCYIGSDTPF